MSSSKNGCLKAKSLIAFELNKEAAYPDSPSTSARIMRPPWGSELPSLLESSFLSRRQVGRRGRPDWR
jgi:hypothetical protein